MIRLPIDISVTPIGVQIVVTYDTYKVHQWPSQADYDPTHGFWQWLEEYATVMFSHIKEIAGMQLVSVNIAPTQAQFSYKKVQS